MEKESLIVALKNALERNESLEDAKTSLLNAGYNRKDIERAAKAIEKLELIGKQLPKFKKTKGIIPPPPSP